MISAPIAPRVLKFVSENLDTVPELEALLLMSESGDRAWTDVELGSRTYVSPQAARLVLEALCRRGFVTADASAFRFAPSTAENRELIQELAAAYRLHLIPLTTFLHSKGTSSVKEFARAFDMKRDK
jgi:hypothetical protein